MSLNYNLARVKNGKKLCDKKNWGLTQGIIFTMMRIGMSSITKENQYEVAARIAWVEKLKGCMMFTAGGKDCPIRLADVRKYIGLTTNAENVPLKTWLTRTAQDEYQERVYVIKHERENLDRVKPPAKRTAARTAAVNGHVTPPRSA